MTIHISFRHMSPSDALKTYAETKSQKLGDGVRGEVQVYWSFTIEHVSRVVHCHLIGKDMDCFAESATGDFMHSVDQATKKLARQLKRRRSEAGRRLRRLSHKSSVELKEKYLKLKEGL